MKRIVVDASVAMTWCFPNEKNDYADRVLQTLTQAQAVVPSLWPVEVANALLVGERRKRLSAAETTHFLSLLSGLSVEIDSLTAQRALSHTLPLSRTHGLSVYDATYLELAMREGIPLATLDAALHGAARSTGVKIVS